MRRLLTALALILITGALSAPSAHAAHSTVYPWEGGSVFLACKTAASGPYGPVWQVQLVLAQNPVDRVRHLRAALTVHRMGADGRFRPLATTRLATDRVGQWDVGVATASQLGRNVGGRWHADRLSFSIQSENGGVGDSLAIGLIRSC